MALAVNLDARRYGTFAEIGAGREVVRWFFRVGGAAGTIAKSISAYDMTVSDATHQEMADSVGLPIRSGIVVLDDAPRAHGVRSRVKLIASGKPFSADRAALALGADLANVARAWSPSGAFRRRSATPISVQLKSRPPIPNACARWWSTRRRGAR